MRRPSAAGLVALGVGDTAASVVGSCVGRARIRGGGGKTWEGLCGGAAAMLAATAGLLAAAAALGAGQGEGQGGALGSGWRLAGLVGDVGLHAVLCAVLEAFTQQLDNLVLPLWHTTCMLLVAAAHV